MEPVKTGQILCCAKCGVELQVVKDCAEAGVNYVWMHKSFGNSVNDEAVQFCRDHGINVIPGACPMMFCEPVDVFHKCFKWALGAFGRLPKGD